MLIPGELYTLVVDHNVGIHLHMMHVLGDLFAEVSTEMKPYTDFHLKAEKDVQDLIQTR